MRGAAPTAEQEAKRIAKMLRTRKRNAALRAKGIHVPSKYKPKKKATKGLAAALRERDTHVPAVAAPADLEQLAKIIIAVWRAM